jgi:3-oxoacyl-[acyl-carrier protein] reductase
VEGIEAAQGRLDILVNNAGFTRDMLALRMADEDWNAVLEVDLNAPFRLARAACADDEAPCGAHRLHRLHRRRHRQCGAGELRRRQGRADRHEQGARPGGGAAPRHDQRGGAGFIATPMTDKLNEAQRTTLLSRIR